MGALWASAQQLNAHYLGYIDCYKEIAMEQCRSHGVPASITLAQGLLESNAGRSYLATRGNNHFGIKCHSWTGEVVEYDDTLKHDCYRKYGSPSDSFLDHSRFLCGRRYQPLHQLDTTDYRGWAEGLKACGYAEDPAYPQKLIALIEQYSLHRYDTIAIAPVKTFARKSASDTPHSAVPVRQRPSRHEAAPVPPPRNRHAKPASTKGSTRKNKRRTTVELQPTTQHQATTTHPSSEPSTPKDAPRKRPRNQRPTQAKKPLTGNADNDD